MAKAYLVDGSGYIFRAFYAVPFLTNREGFPTNALYGFMRMLLKLLKDAQSEHIAVVFDAGRATFRNELYDQYKANRREAPEDLAKQFPFFRTLARALGLPVLELPGFEADDVIATLTHRFQNAGTETVVVSGDKDLLQLVSPGVSVWDTMKDKHYGAAEVREKFGVGPERVPEMLALIGDSSDNIPGLSGVGPKTAVQLIEKFGTVEALLSNAEAVGADSSIRNRKKIAELIVSEAEIVRLSRKLVEVDRHCPVEIAVGEKHHLVSELNDAELLAALSRGPIDYPAMHELIVRFEFSSLITEFGFNLDEPSEHATECPCTIVLEENFDQFVRELRRQPRFSFDTETTSLDPLAAKLVSLSFCWGDDHAYYLPLRHRDVQGQVSVERFVAELGPRFEDPAVKKGGQNLKYDIAVLAGLGIEVQGCDFDTMIAAYVLAPDRGSYNLTVLAHDFLHRRIIEYDEVVTGDCEDIGCAPLDAAARYACQDAHCAWLLEAILRKRLEEEELLSAFREVEMPLVPVLSRMELTGVALDTERLAEISAEFALELERMEGQIFAMAGSNFNINSPKQLADVLFNKLGLPTKGLKKTKTGISTDSSVLEKLALEHPLPGLILEYRSIHKLKSTYVDALPAQISPVTGRLHTRFNQTGTGTGRLSSSDPNLQNIPVQTAQGRRIRETFIAHPASEVTLISADYSQIELRVLAHLSHDPALLRAFQENIDIHAQTAREILHLPAGSEVTAEMRRIGKTINFGVIYGMSGFRLSRDLGIPVGVGNTYIENYFRNYSGVREFFDRLEQEAIEKGFVRTILGRKRTLSQIDSSGRDQGFMRRAALNAPIQGSAADLMKLAMIAIDNRIRREKLPLTMLLQIHDELLFECRHEFVATAKALIKEVMEGVIELDVPLEVHIGEGANWQQAHA